MKIYLLWALKIVMAEVILTALQAPLKKRNLKTPARVALIIGKFLLAVAFAALVLAGPVVLRPVQPIMLALYVALVADSLADACCTVFYAVKKRERKFSVVKITSIVFCLIFAVYGTVNMEIVTPAYRGYSSPKIKREHKIVFIADIHTGSPQDFGVIEKTVEKIKSEKPEFVILGGDIVDDYTTKEDMQRVFSLYGGCGIPVFYIYGNHDRQAHAQYANGVQFTPEELENTLYRNGIIILKDEFYEISRDLILLGREDKSVDTRLDINSLDKPMSEKFLLVADHQPVAFEEHSDFGADMQVSGHTHAGQLFPLRLLYALIGGKVYGEYKTSASTLIVSAGAGGWRVPLRTDAHCNFEVITLKPSE